MTTMLLAVHAASTLAMAGLIWFVQVVHYPLFAAVGAEAFPEYARRHVSRTSAVVAPLMLAETSSAVALTIWTPPGAPAGLVAAGLLLLIGVWLSTALLQVPAHRRLARGLDLATVRALVRGNWVRTALWSARAVVALALLTAAGR